ncbi:MAG: PilZ domain-containing protein [Desulfobulbaceae bacterium]|nr:PilZ domain-containing protein [Desulfobulbaceae bacterium]
MYSGQITNSVEMRECERFFAQHRALVLIYPNSSPVHVIDISKKGLAFKYLGKETLAIETEKLALYYENKTCMHDIPFEIASDDIINRNSYVPFRRCGIKFGKLTSTQQTFINDFITTYTC